MTDNDNKGPKKDEPTPKGALRPQSPLWTLDKIRALSDADVKNLKANAERLANATVTEICEAILLERIPDCIPKRSKGQTIAANAKDKLEEKSSAALLAILAKRLLERFDLSKETAKNLSEGTKNFSAHSLTGKNGTAKVGGGQRTGDLIFGRYISYRIGNETCELNVVKFPDRDEIFYEVFAPKRFFEKPVPITKLRPYLKKGSRITVADWGQHFDSFNSAAVFFEEVLEKFAIKRA